MTACVYLFVVVVVCLCVYLYIYTCVCVCVRVRARACVHTGLKKLFETSVNEGVRRQARGALEAMNIDVKDHQQCGIPATLSGELPRSCINTRLHSVAHHRV
jgi:hypothetical protein